MLALIGWQLYNVSLVSYTDYPQCCKKSAAIDFSGLFFRKQTMIFDNIDKLSDISDKWVLTIGNFDGFHKGHRQIVSTAISRAKQLGCKTAVITFRPHPASILRPDRAPQLISTFEIKCNRILDFGVDAIVAIEDSYSLLNLSPEKFVDDFLMKSIQPLAFVEGDNFHFGYGRSGSIQTLQRLGETRGFEVIAIELKKISFEDGLQRVSSTLIRDFLSDGRVEDAALAMDREFRLIGQIIKGRGIGSGLGFPTANINPKNQVIPADGVYAGYVLLGESQEDVSTDGGEMLPAVYSIGRAKTFIEQENPLLIEAHILDSDEKIKGGIYDKWLAMDFVARIRPQQRFENFDKLKEQIAKDCKTAREILKFKSL